jgi:hypothetical protein
MLEFGQNTLLKRFLGGELSTPLGLVVLLIYQSF